MELWSCKTKEVLQEITSRMVRITIFLRSYRSYTVRYVANTTASERTFLAWLRTSLSFASIGIAVTQLFRLDQTLAQTPHDHPRVQKLRHVGKPLGATFLAVGILVLLIGFHRYFESQHYVMLGKFPAGRGNIALVAFCAGALTVASLVVILSISPGALT